MIISASYKTDIPAFYGEWFMNRLRAGSCKMVNPYGGQIYTISLAREDVDGFVFWTKNIGPLLKHLPEVHERSYPFIVQHTITGYPRELEYRVINATHTIAHMQRLVDTYGQAVAVWRYDPVVFSSLTPIDWHRRNFATLAQALEGTTDEVIVSFAQIYKKTKRNMTQAAQEFGFSWHEHEIICQEQGRDLAVEFAQIAAAHGMQLKICSQKAFLVPGVTAEARCVDAQRLEKVAGQALAHTIQLKGNRQECGCFASRDIGEYDTCPHGCVYCYAVQHRDLALSRYKAHDPAGEFLFPPRDTLSNDQGKTPEPQVIPAVAVRKKADVDKDIQATYAQAELRQQRLF